MVRAGTKEQPLLMFKVTPAQAEPRGIPQELQRLGVRALLSTPSPFRSLRHTQHISTASFGVRDTNCCGSGQPEPTARGIWNRAAVSAWRRRPAPARLGSQKHAVTPAPVS